MAGQGEQIKLIEVYLGLYNWLLAARHSVEDHIFTKNILVTELIIIEIKLIAVLIKVVLYN